MILSSDHRLRVVIDTREQTPWSFPEEKVVAFRGTLPTGDYALEDDDFAIERKELNDFLGSISSNYERFCRELERMVSPKIILVESNFEACCFNQCPSGDITNPHHNHPNLTPGFICKRVAELTMMGVCVLFATDPGQAAAIAYQILKQRQLRLLNGND